MAILAQARPAGYREIRGSAVWPQAVATALGETESLSRLQESCTPLRPRRTLSAHRGNRRNGPGAQRDLRLTAGTCARPVARARTAAGTVGRVVPARRVRARRKAREPRYAGRRVAGTKAAGSRGHRRRTRRRRDRQRLAESNVFDRLTLIDWSRSGGGTCPRHVAQRRFAALHDAHRGQHAGRRCRRRRYRRHYRRGVSRVGIGQMNSMTRQTSAKPVAAPKSMRNRPAFPTNDPGSLHLTLTLDAARTLDTRTEVSTSTEAHVHRRGSMLKDKGKADPRKLVAIR